MAENGKHATPVNWLEASGLPYIARTFATVLQPSRLGIALVCLLATLLLGWVLDAVWKQMGRGVEPDAIKTYRIARQADREIPGPPTGETPKKDKAKSGVFEVWSLHEKNCVLGLMSSAVPGAEMVAAGSPVEAYLHQHTGPATTLGSLAEMAYGVLWLAQTHPCYFVFFAVGALLNWSLGGGALCRIAAVQFAREEKLSVGQAFSFARTRWFGSLFLAPVLPLLFMLGVMVLMVLGGMVLWIPIFGDLVAGGAFILALLGGFVIALLLLGLLAGGSLLWPTVAAEGSDAFDAFSRSVSYVLSRPWKTMLYLIIALVYGSLCWLFVRLITFAALKFTHIVVGYGTSFFGATSDKVDRLWPMAGLGQLHTAPDWSQLSWYESISAFFIWIAVLLVVALMWSFLVSFYFTASTVIYFLLRRDVDHIDLEDIYLDEEPEEATASTGADAAPAT